MTDNLPSRVIDTSQWETVKELELADPEFNKPSSIELFIATSHYENIMFGNNRLKKPNCEKHIGFQKAVPLCRYWKRTDRKNLYKRSADFLCFFRARKNAAFMKNRRISSNAALDNQKTLQWLLQGNN